MGGLALGSFAFGRRVDRQRNPLATYALLGGRHRRLRHLREGRPRRRHVAREHLPGPRRATCRRTSTPTPSRPTRTGATGSRPAPRSRPTSSASPPSTASSSASASATRSRAASSPTGAGTSTTRTGHHDDVDVVIAATGVLHHPHYPDIEGLDTFDGALFHSARWDHDVPLDGARVGVIGTGSTAVQIVVGDRRPGRAAHAVPAHRAVDHAAGEPRLLRRGAGRVPRRSRSSGRAARRPGRSCSTCFAERRGRRELAAACR